MPIQSFGVHFTHSQCRDNGRIILNLQQTFLSDLVKQCQAMSKFTEGCVLLLGFLSVLFQLSLQVANSTDQLESRLHHLIEGNV